MQTAVFFIGNSDCSYKKNIIINNIWLYIDCLVYEWHKLKNKIDCVMFNEGIKLLHSAKNVPTNLFFFYFAKQICIHELLHVVLWGL